MVGVDALVLLLAPRRGVELPSRRPTGKQRPHRERGNGLDTRSRRDVGIVTWVSRDPLGQRDSKGHSGIVGPGAVRSEKDDAWRLGRAPHDEAVRFIQMWVVLDERAIAPAYEQFEIEPSRQACTISDRATTVFQLRVVAVRRIWRRGAITDRPSPSGT